ncbi:M23 family metallopeptidase [bacterium]|nr:M23 family metallopeptidase [bacterium]
MKLQKLLEQGKISVTFGKDFTGDSDKGKFYEIFSNKHPGLDFDIPVGTKILNSFRGIVVRKEFHKGMGNTVSIRNGNIVALYAHLSVFSVNLAQIVKTGDVIGFSGDTGEACLEPHLHFEVRDISKSSLKDMVFNPIFEKDIKQHSEVFTYKVNNKNTPKNLNNLSTLFFGSTSYAEKLSKINLLDIDSDSLLEEGIIIKIPNF